MFESNDGVHEGSGTDLVSPLSNDDKIAIADQRQIIRLLERAKGYLTKANRIDEIKEFRDKNAALLAYLKQKHDSSKESLRYADEVKTRAEIRIGQLLAVMAKQMSKQEVIEMAALNGLSVSQAKAWLRLAVDLGEYDEAAIKTIRNKSKDSAINVCNVEDARNQQFNDFREIEFDGDEWYSPKYIVESARQTMGSIDLDPSSCPLANKTVKAKEFFSKQDSGLSHRWKGNVYFAPPYSRNLIGKFAAKLVLEFNAGNVAQAVGIVHSSTDASWYQALVENSAMLCFPRERICFQRHTNEVMATPGGQTIFYFGTNTPAFVREFGGTGVLVIRFRGK